MILSDDKMLPKAHLPEGVYAGGMRTFMEKYPEVASLLWQGGTNR